MSCNVSIQEGIFRLIAGVVFAGITGAMGWWIGILALYPIVSAMSAWDPIYAMMGKSTITEQIINPMPGEKLHGSDSTKKAA